MLQTEPVAPKAGAGKTAATAAMSTLLAVSLAGALSEPPNTDQMILPEPTPIVRIYQEDEPEEPVPEPEEEVDERAERWRRLSSSSSTWRSSPSLRRC